MDDATMQDRTAAVTAALLCVALAACSSSSSPPLSGDAGAVDSEGGASADAAETLTYPPPPYGIAEGDTFPDATWDGFRSGTTDTVKISSIDYYDPKGDRGIRVAAIFF